MAKVIMIGAGSVVFTKTLLGDILSLPALSETTIGLVDIDPVRLRTAKTMVERIIETLGVKARVEASLDRRTMLVGADYVINAIQVGMHQATLLDFNIPRKYGLKQTIGDTLGVGGIFRGLRTIPVLVDILRDMEETCPDALLINYTNPMGILGLAAAKTSAIKFVGLCHSVQGTAGALAEYIGIPGSELSYRVAGINHMAWFLQLKHGKENAYPRLFQAMEDPAIYRRDKVRFEMMRRTGYFVTESSEHMAEYVPYFLGRDELIKEFDIPIDEYIRRSEQNLRSFEETRRALEEHQPVEVKRSYEYAATIINSIETGFEASFYGNVPNTGLITNLPAEACVEVPCLVDGAGIQPCHVGDLPLQLAALNRNAINVQQLTVEAALTGKKEYVYHAVMMDPRAASTLTLDEIWRMVDELVEAHGLRLR